MKQSAALLSYRLLEGRVDLRPLRILASRTSPFRSWTVTVSVLGASHAVEIVRNGVCVTELLTCVEPAAEDGALISLRSGTDVGGCATAGGLLCRVQLRRFALLEGDALTGCYDPSSRLDVSFPCGGRAAPVTRVGWRADREHLTIETVHSYPEEAAGVRSKTVFTPEEDCSEHIE